MASDFSQPDNDYDLTALALAVECSGTGIWDRDIQSGRIHYSDAWKAILGYKPDEIGSDIADSYSRVHPDDLDPVKATIDRHLREHSDTYEVEHRLRCKDGSYKWVLSRGKVASRDADGNPLRMMGVTTDISATIALSEKLRQTAELLAYLTDEVPGLVYQYQRGADGHGSFTYASAGIRDIFGVGADLAARDAACVEAVIHPDDLAGWHATLAASAATLQRWEFEFRVITPAGEAQWRRGQARPRAMPDGSTVWHGFMADITEHKQIQERLQDAAQTDFLTGLPNRRYVIARMEQELALIERAPDQTSAVLMCDLDHFKDVNDKYGHATGDEVLKHFARMLREELRKVDTVGRIGGEEFAVILPGASTQDARAFAERLRGRMAAEPLHNAGVDVPCTVSIGIAAMHTADTNVADSLSRADAALYRAKLAGRNRVETGHI